MFTCGWAWPARWPIRFWASGKAKFTKICDSLPCTPMNRRAKCDADKPVTVQTHTKTRWKVLWENTTPAKAKFGGGVVANTWQHLPHLLLDCCTQQYEKCKQLPVYEVFFNRYAYFHIPLPIVTKHELGLPFPPRNLPIKCGTNPSTILLVFVVTNTQTHKPTPVKTYSLAFAGRKTVNDRCTRCLSACVDNKWARLVCTDWSVTEANDQLMAR